MPGQGRGQRGAETGKVGSWSLFDLGQGGNRRHGAKQAGAWLCLVLLWPASSIPTPFLAGEL